MPRYVVHHEGIFFEWSTIVDAPVSYGMTQEEYEKYYLYKYGSSAMEDFPARLERAVQNGTSCHRKMSFDELIKGNRAGPNETEISKDEILKEIMNIPKE